ncbi:MAG: three-Cys-motif partner protein TcmP [Chromatiales bacterium]|nr:three-Cys-motif partner protein TcmP [Chromatiales bacterium]
MKPHTKEKIAVYEAYLTHYLFVMCNSDQWDRIAVWEPFAGEGVYDGGEKGSAMVAVETIKEFREKYNKKDIRLFLNELDDEKHRRLEKSMDKYLDFVKTFNADAKKFLDGMSHFLAGKRNLHSLVFIDPYGYTQYSKDNLVRLFSLRNIDYLIFMPTYHIYRFKDDKDNKDDKDKPARRFLLNLGMSESELSKSKKHTFADKLIKILKEMAQTEYGYSYELENRNVANTHYHLFFITKHRTGAEKFLKAKNDIKNKLEQQLTFSDFNNAQINQYLSELLKKQGPISNTELSEEIVKKGFLPPDVRPVLQEMEIEGKLEIIPKQKRTPGAFYLTEYKDRNKYKDKITISLKKNRNPTLFL